MIYLVTYIQHGLFLSTSYVYMHFSFWLLKWREWLWNYSNSFGHVIMHAVNMYLYIKKTFTVRKKKCRTFGSYFTRPKQHTCYSFYHNLETLDRYLTIFQRTLLKRAIIPSLFRLCTSHSILERSDVDLENHIVVIWRIGSYWKIKSIKKGNLIGI